MVTIDPAIGNLPFIIDKDHPFSRDTIREVTVTIGWVGKVDVSVGCNGQVIWAVESFALIGCSQRREAFLSDVVKGQLGEPPISMLADNEVACGIKSKTIGAQDPALKKRNSSRMSARREKYIGSFFLGPLMNLIPLHVREEKCLH